MSREIFVIKARKEQESWGVKRAKWRGEIVLYYENGEDFSWVEKTYKFKTLSQFRHRFRKINTNFNSKYYYVHVVPTILLNEL